MSELSASAETLLVVLAEQEGRAAADGREIELLKRATDMLDEQVFWSAARELEERSFARVSEGAFQKQIVTTESGQQAARALAVVPPEGRVSEFASALDDVRLAILDAVTEEQLKIPGGTSVRRSTIRFRIRKLFPTLGIPAATAAIDDLAKLHLRPTGGTEPSYQADLRGFLASQWGMNSLQIVEHVLALLETLLAKDPSVRQYSWRQLREQGHLPHKALNIAYDTIMLTQLGHGLFEHSGERWWSIPPDPDVIVECGGALAYVRGLVARSANEAGTRAPDEAAPSRPNSPEQQTLFTLDRVDDAEDEDTSTPLNDGEIRDPFDPNKIRVRQWSPTVYNLMERLEHKELDLAPEFQRRAGVWTSEKQSRLIESLLMRIPLPAFYLDELPPKDGDLTERYAVVDGVQRLYVLDRFINKRDLALEGLEFLKLGGKRFADLPPPLQRRILEAQLTVNLVEAGTPDDAKLNIFKRINTGGVPLIAQEIRHAMSPQVAREWLKNVGESDAFRTAVGEATAEKMSVRMQDRECVTRFVAFLDDGVEKYRQASTDFDAFLLGAMKRIAEMDHRKRDELEQRFRRAMAAAHECFGPNAFRRIVVTTNRRAPVNKALFEATAINLDRRPDAELSVLASRANRVRELYALALENKETSDAVSVGTGDVRRVERRFEALKAILDGALR